MHTNARLTDLVLLRVFLRNPPNSLLFAPRYIIMPSFGDINSP